MNRYIDDLRKNSELMKRLDMSGGVCSTIEEVKILLERLSISKESSTLKCLKMRHAIIKLLGTQNI